MKMKAYLKSSKEEVYLVLDEKHIQETINKSIDIYCMNEQKSVLDYGEFLWLQLRHIRKRWWFFQIFLLLTLGGVLSQLQITQHFQRSMGIVSTLFVILIIPELWKSRTHDFMEIEASSFYSLQQIYATRMMLFGIVDISLLTVFCVISSMTLQVTLTDLLVHFFFPMVVTTCICFGMLCSKYPFSETFAIVSCLVWSAIWLVVVLNDKVYTAIAIPIWITLLVISLIICVFMCYRVIRDCNNYWEVDISGINTY